MQGGNGWGKGSFLCIIIYIHILYIYIYEWYVNYSNVIFQAIQFVTFLSPSWRSPTNI